MQRAEQEVRSVHHHWRSSMQQPKLKRPVCFVSFACHYCQEAAEKLAAAKAAQAKAAAAEAEDAAAKAAAAAAAHHAAVAKAELSYVHQEWQAAPVAPAKAAVAEGCETATPGDTCYKASVRLLPLVRGM